MEFLIRFAQAHETFRRPELEALAIVHGISLEIVEYSEYVCLLFEFMILKAYKRRKIILFNVSVI